MCRQDSATHLSAEEKIAAEESLSTYCKPVELYNILQRRAVRNVMYLKTIFTYSSRPTFLALFLVDINGLGKIVDFIVFVYMHQTFILNKHILFKLKCFR